MRAFECLPTDQIFSHTDLSGLTRHFNASAIVRAVYQRTITPDFATLDLWPEIVAVIEKNHGVEEARLKVLTDDMLEPPVLMALFNDNSNLLIAGNHRIVKRFRKGLKTVDALVVSEADWVPYLVEDFDASLTIDDICRLAQRQ